MPKFRLSCVGNSEREDLFWPQLPLFAETSENTARTTTGGPATVDRDRDGVDDRAEGAGAGAGIGATAGGLVGLLTGLGLLAIPGVGPVVAALHH